MFVPDSRGVLHAYNAQTGAELWNHAMASAMRRHHQLLRRWQAVRRRHRRLWRHGQPMGWEAAFGEPYKSMPRDEGLLVVYSLK